MSSINDPVVLYIFFSFRASLDFLTRVYSCELEKRFLTSVIRDPPFLVRRTERTTLIRPRISTKDRGLPRIPSRVPLDSHVPHKLSSLFSLYVSEEISDRWSSFSFYLVPTIFLDTVIPWLMKQVRERRITLRSILFLTASSRSVLIRTIKID